MCVDVTQTPQVTQFDLVLLKEIEKLLKKLLFIFLYNLFQTKLAKLRRYLDNVLKKS